MTELAIEARKLTKKFRKTLAVDDLDLKVPWGSIYGLLGRNGAGKTTTIKMLLGLLSMTSGEATVLGYSSKREPLRIKAEVGYVPETQKMYEWMSISEIIRFTSAFYPTWNQDVAEELLNRFHLDGRKKIKQLSKGMVAKVSLILALSHEPRVLILDDPTSGLDPVVRRQFLESIVELAHKEGRTIFFSSHLLGDIERICDRVGIISHGRMKVEARVDDLKASVKKILVRFEHTPPSDLKLEGIINQETSDTTMSITVENYSDEILQKIKSYKTKSIKFVDLSLEDIFVEYLGKEAD